jgi:hypothetical protein
MIIELRRYHLRPGRRDELIELFDREFVESQEALGMRIIGQFRDLDSPDDFVWLRGFDDMPSRPAALAAFYGGPVWKQHREAANATMIDSDDVLLLRLHRAFGPWPPAGGRPPAGTVGDERGAVLVRVRPVGTALETGQPGTPVVELATEPTPNNFPALPVREGETVQVSISTLPDAAQAATVPRAEGLARLIPTARSLLHG